MDPILGSITIIPFSWAPVDFLICNGQQVAVNQYQALYSLIANLYGGSSNTNFNLPNLQGRMPIGIGSSQASGQPYHQLATTGGNEAVALSATNLPIHTHPAAFTPTSGSQSVTIPGTTGNLGVTATPNLTASTSGALKIGNQTATGATALAPNAVLTKAGGGQGAIYGNPSSVTADTVIGPTQTFTGPVSGTISTSVTGTASTAATTVSIPTITGGSVMVGNNATNNTPISTLSPYLTLNFIIAMNGIYPQRP